MCNNSPEEYSKHSIKFLSHKNFTLRLWVLVLHKHRWNQAKKALNVNDFSFVVHSQVTEHYKKGTVKKTKQLQFLSTVETIRKEIGNSNPFVPEYRWKSYGISWDRMRKVCYIIFRTWVRNWKKLIRTLAQPNFAKLKIQNHFQ